MTLKSFIAALCIIAVAVNPVAAGWVSCCCITRTQVEAKCCPETVSQPALSPKTTRQCCQKASLPPASAVKASCCCAHTPPAIIPGADRLVKPPAEHELVSTALWLPADANTQSPGFVRFHTKSSGRSSLSGPSLLALHCIWLK